jgi:outer membrane protein assembly factor BamA
LYTKFEGLLKTIKYLCLIIVVFSHLKGEAQSDTLSIRKNVIPDKTAGAVIDSSKQRDVIDFLQKIVKKDAPANSRLHAKKLVFSVVPAVGYSLTTGFAADITANMAFYTNANHTNNLSAIDLETVYDTKNQKIFASRSEIWYDNNNYKLITDVRWEEYPIDTYGLGTSSTTATTNPLVYNYTRLYGTFFKKITGDNYIGVGYNLDHHYNITQAGNANNTVPDFTKYGFNPTSTSSGIVLDFLFDNRKNPINPLNGAYTSIIYRDNFAFLGSDSHWQELSMDFRKYFRLSPNNNNILALWSILAFTNGNVPYLDLPYTASDTYNNSGRGYPEQRFRGKNELYLESEYRFGITNNGLLGGVVFANAESFSELQTDRFEKVAPAAGTGLRLKINKHSNTNVCLDYAYGINSHGIFVNLGEMF